MTSPETPALRELFIDDLLQVNGGGPVEDLINRLTEPQPSTMACCEEGPDGCCNSPWTVEPGP